VEGTEMTVQCEAATDAQVSSEEDADRHMTLLMHLDAGKLTSLNSPDLNVLRVRLTKLLNTVEEEQDRRGAEEEADEWRSRHSQPQPQAKPPAKPQTTGPTPRTVADRCRRPVGTR